MYLPPKILLSPVRDSPGGFNSKKPEPDTSLKAPTSKKCTILLVDDEPILLKAYERILKPFGHDFKKAGDGVEALELFRQGGIGLVVSDYDMPKMNGLELVMKARELDPTIKFIFLTGNDSPDRRALLLDAGAFDILSKPIVREELKDSVEFALAMGAPKAAPLVDNAIGDATSPEHQEPSKIKKPGTILIVEDNDDIRSSMTDLLGIFGYGVKSASNGQEGLDMVRAGGIDIVVSDYTMPIMDGLSMLNAIKKEMPGLKVVMTTAYGDDHETTIKMLEAGADAVLTKPIDIVYLQATLSKLI